MFLKENKIRFPLPSSPLLGRPLPVPFSQLGAASSRGHVIRGHVIKCHVISSGTMRSRGALPMIGFNTQDKERTYTFRVKPVFSYNS